MMEKKPTGGGFGRKATVWVGLVLAFISSACILGVPSTGARSGLAEFPGTFAPLVKAASPAVVNISTVRIIRGDQRFAARPDPNESWYEFLERYFRKDGQGALVCDVMRDGPAAEAGLKRGDVIVAFDDKPVTDADELPFAVAAAPIDRTIALRIVRQGRELKIDATVKVMPVEDEIPAAPASKATLGMVLEELTPEAVLQYELSETSGLVVTRIEEGSGAQEAGLEPGDVILEADQVAVQTLAAYEQKMQAFSIGDTILFLVSRSGATFFVTLKTE